MNIINLLGCYIKGYHCSIFIKTIYRSNKVKNIAGLNLKFR